MWLTRIFNQIFRLKWRQTGWVQTSNIRSLKHASHWKLPRNYSTSMCVEYVFCIHRKKNSSDDLLKSFLPSTQHNNSRVFTQTYKLILFRRFWKYWFIINSRTSDLLFDRKRIQPEVTIFNELYVCVLTNILPCFCS